MWLQLKSNQMTYSHNLLPLKNPDLYKVDYDDIIQIKYFYKYNSTEYLPKSCAKKFSWYSKNDIILP